MPRPKALYVLNLAHLNRVYGPAEQADIAQLVDFVGPPQSPATLAANPGLMRHVEVMLSTWGAPKIDDAFLDNAPNLKAIFYGAGAIGGWTTEALWERGVTITTATSANAVPVAEYTLAMIVLGLKRVFASARLIQETRRFAGVKEPIGAYKSTVGLLSLGTIARRLLELLRPFEMNVVVCDPFLTAEEAERLGVRLVTIDELFATSDVVSVHTPLLPETASMIRAEHFAAMRDGSTFINTARGGVVNEPDLIAAAQARPNLQFVLDVTDPEPPAADSPLYTLPNIFLTPHVAGSTGGECARMGRYMVDELRRYIAGEPLKWAVSRQAAESSAHRPGKAGH
ncbi:MAG: hydroxyacid dehydrogenase [Tepidisphaeraceae bacterium]